MAFGDRRGRHGARHREPELTEHDPELDSYLAALAPDEGGDGRGAEVLQIRLPGPVLERLRTAAEQRGTSPAALVTDWVAERLGDETPTGPLRLR